MSEKEERHSIIPRCPVLKCGGHYKIIQPCKSHSNQINSNLLGFIHMHPVHEEVAPFNLAGTIIDIKELPFIQKKPLSEDYTINDSAGLKKALMDDMEYEEQKNESVRECDEIILTVSKEPKTYLKKVKSGDSPTTKVSEIINIEENSEKSHFKIKTDIIADKQSNKLNIAPPLQFSAEDKIQNNVNFMPGLKLSTMKLLPTCVSSQSSSLKSQQAITHFMEVKKTGKTSLKAEVKLIAKFPEPNNGLNKGLSIKPVVKTTNLQGKRIVIVTKKDNIMLKPLTSLSSSNPIILKQPVKNMLTLNDNQKQIGGSKLNIQFKKIVLAGVKSTQTKNLNLKIDNEKKPDKIVITEDNDSCSNCSKQVDKKLNEVTLKDNHNELDNIGNNKIKLVNNLNEKNCSEKELNLKNVSDVNLNKKSLIKDPCNDNLTTNGSEKRSEDSESNYSAIMEGNLSKDAITEIILGKNSYNPPKSKYEDSIAAETEEENLGASSETRITTSENSIPVETPEARKRQITPLNNDNKNNKRFCLSKEKPQELNNRDSTKFLIEDNANKTINRKADDYIGLSPAYQYKEASDIENPRQTVLSEIDLFGNNLGDNFDDFLKDLGRFDIVDSNMPSELSSWGPLLIDDDITDEIIRNGNHVGHNKLLHGYQQPDPFLITPENKLKYKKWQYKFFLDMKYSLQKDFAGNMKIHEAVLKEDQKTLHKQCLALLARVRTVDVKNNDGSTPLHLAILNRVNPDVISILLKFKASITTIDNDGNNAFHLAAYSSEVEYVRRLLECSNGHQERCDITNFDGLTPLMISVLNNDYVIVEQLLLGGFSPNLRDQKSGRTALFHAVEQNEERLVKLLLYHGGDTRIENYFGTSPHDAVYELSNVKSGIKSLIHEIKKLEKAAKRNKNSCSPRTPLARNIHRSSVTHVIVNNSEEINHRTYGVSRKRRKLEHED